MVGFLLSKPMILAAANLDLAASGANEEIRPRDNAVNTTAANTL